MVSWLFQTGLSSGLIQLLTHPDPRMPVFSSKTEKEKHIFLIFFSNNLFRIAVRIHSWEIYFYLLAWSPLSLGWKVRGTLIFYRSHQNNSSGWIWWLHWWRWHLSIMGLPLTLAGKSYPNIYPEQEMGGKNPQLGLASSRITIQDTSHSFSQQESDTYKSSHQQQDQWCDMSLTKDHLMKETGIYVLKPNKTQVYKYRICISRFGHFCQIANTKLSVITPTSSTQVAV